MAGIRVVVGESIERIYNENCQNLGILTTTDFGLIERIRSGEPIPLSEFTAGADEITRQIVEYGGALRVQHGSARGGGRPFRSRWRPALAQATRDRPQPSRRTGSRTRAVALQSPTQ